MPVDDWLHCCLQTPFVIMPTVTPKPPSPAKSPFHALGASEQLPPDFHDLEVSAASKPIPTVQEQNAQMRKVRLDNIWRS
jgi:hypothetical protein